MTSEPQTVAAPEDAQALEAGEEPVVPETHSVINVSIKLPGGSSWSFACAQGETIADLKMTLWECEEMCFVTSYDLFVGDEQLNDFIPIESLPTVTNGSTLEVRRAAYNKRAVAVHIGRLLSLQEAADPDCVLPAILAELNELEAVVKPQAQQPQLQQQQQQQQGAKMSANKKKKAKKKRKKAAAAMNNSNRAKTAATALAQEFSVEACLDTDLRRLFPHLEQLEGAGKGPLLVAPSKWGMPSPARELHGDICYLKVKTLDGQSYHVTAATNGFFVNKSTKERFNANSSSKTFHELPTLISSLNPAFEKAFQELLSKRLAHGPLGPFLFDPIQGKSDKRSWLMPFSRQKERGEPSGYIRIGEEIAYSPDGLPLLARPSSDSARDWNAEVQSLRDMEQVSMMDAVMRDRGLHMVQVEFIEAATQGAMRIVNKDLLPANPNDDPALHLFVLNNIFSNGDKYENEDGTLCSSSDDPHRYKISNNDILGTTVYNHINIKGLHTVMTTLVTYKGVRVFAQAIVPGILQAEPAPILYGSIDYGKTMGWDEEVHKLMVEAASYLNLAVHNYEAADGTQHPIAASVAAKSIRGNDGRFYIMDLDCPSAPDTAWGQRWAIYRPELLRRFVERTEREYAKAVDEANRHNAQIDAQAEEEAKQEGKGKQEEEAVQEEETKQAKEEEEATEEDKPDETTGGEDGKPKEKIVIPPFSKPAFNPNLHAVTFHGKVVGEEEDINHQKALHKSLEVYLTKVAIPCVAEDIITSELPIDSEKLKFILQARGVNMRYLGALAAMMPAGMEYQHQLLHREMLVRSAKHLYNTLILLIPRHQHAEATAHYISCLVQGLGSLLFVSLMKASPAEDDTTLDMLKLKQTSLHRQLIALAERNYKAKADGFAQLYKQGEQHRQSLLRAFCIKSGIMIRPRKYNFSKPFSANDIAALVPVTKASLSGNSTALTLMDAGDLLMMQGKLEDAYEAYSEALSYCHHTTGSLHNVAAVCFLKLAEVVYRAGDLGQAVQNVQHAIIILERVRGPDRHDVAIAYLTLATYLENAGQPLRALVMHKRALYLFLLFGGERHPCIGSIHLRIGRLLQGLNANETALQHIARALEHFETVYGPDHFKTGAVCHMMAQVYSCLNDNKAALDFEKRNYDILVKVLGEKHEQTNQCGIWMKQFTLKAVQEARDARENTNRQLASGAGVPAPDGSEAPLFSRPIADILKYVNSSDAPKQTRRARHPFPTGRRVAQAGGLPQS